MKLIGLTNAEGIDMIAAAAQSYQHTAYLAALKS